MLAMMTPPAYPRLSPKPMKADASPRRLTSYRSAMIAARGAPIIAAPAWTRQASTRIRATDCSIPIPDNATAIKSPPASIHGDLLPHRDLVRSLNAPTNGWTITPAKMEIDDTNARLATLLASSRSVS